MAIQLTAEGLRAIFPRAPQPIIDAFLAKQDVLFRAGITHNRNRLAIALAEVEHECNGYTIPNLTENINYSAERMAEVWPSRFSSAAAVRAKYGTAPGWQRDAFDDIYGNRMGNRPGTDDGSTFIGRGGPQITGRDGYANVAKASGIPIDKSPEYATLPQYQPDMLSGFWTWKNLNPVADTKGIVGVTRIWNGGLIGIGDRRQRLEGNAAHIERFPDVERVLNQTKGLPGQPEKPDKAIAEATDKERKARNTGASGAVVGGGNEAAKATTQQAQAALIPSVAAWTLVGVGVAVAVLCGYLIYRKRKIILARWYE